MKEAPPGRLRQATLLHSCGHEGSRAIAKRSATRPTVFSNGFPRESSRAEPRIDRARVRSPSSAAKIARTSGTCAGKIPSDPGVCSTGTNQFLFCGQVVEPRNRVVADGTGDLVAQLGGVGALIQLPPEIPVRGHHEANPGVDRP